MQLLKTEVHLKTWGEEHWIYNGAYCGKKLFLKKGYRCSLHWHEKKDEVFYVEAGKVLLEADGEHFILRPGSSIHIPPRTKHRFTGLQRSVIFEFSTHHDEGDSYRVTQSGRIHREEFAEISKQIARYRKKR